MEENKLTYEQLEQAAASLQQRCIQAEGRLAALNMTTMRLDYLFKVLKYRDSFDQTFVQQCVNEIKDLLEINEEPVEKPE